MNNTSTSQQGATHSWICATVTFLKPTLAKSAVSWEACTMYGKPHNVGEKVVQERDKYNGINRRQKKSNSDEDRKDIPQHRPVVEERNYQ